ncbi:DUF6527 family protein [Pararoseomonas baculiformis]|uniref:DUF6527 family protein n=1 Tax=Pararoseomonas baculiformis TaxID=2820812 RepID=UPI0038D0E964
MWRTIAKGLRWIGLLRFDLLARTQPTYPEDRALIPGEVIVVEDAGVQKWACLRCPGGCGLPIALSLNAARRPRWKIVLDRWSRPTMEPSVHQTKACGCHFWIKGGRVEWCRDGKPHDRLAS